MKKLKKIPVFKNETEEDEFWSTHDSTDYIDYASGRRVMLPKLKPSVKTISLRLPESLLEHLKMLANKRDIPYQSLLKIYLGVCLNITLRLQIRCDGRWLCSDSSE